MQKPTESPAQKAQRLTAHLAADPVKQARMQKSLERILSRMEELSCLLAPLPSDSLKR